MSNPLFKKLSRIDVHWLVAISGWAARIATVLVRFLMIVVLLDYLGVEQYAICAVVISLEGWFALCDCGLGFSAQNFISEAKAKDGLPDTLLRSIMQLGLSFFLLFSLIIICAAPAISFFLFQNTGHAEQYTSAIRWAGIFYGLGALGTIGYRVLYALQKGYWVHGLQTLSVMLSLGAIWLVTKGDAGEKKLLFSLCFVTGIPALVACIPFFKLFPLRRLFSGMNFSEMKALWLRSLQFWGFAISAILVLGVDYMVMARCLSAGEILLYNVVSKMFVGFFVLYGTLMQAVWPHCSELFTQGRFDEMKRLVKRYSLYGFAFIVVVTSGIALFSPLLCRLFFSNQSLTIPLSTIVLFGCYYVARVFCDPYSMVLQSMNQLKVLLIAVPFQALIGGLCQILFAQKWGVNGVIIGLICSFAATVSWALPLAFYQRVRKELRMVQQEGG